MIKSVARKSNSVLADLGTDIQWVQSYVVNGMVYCVYNAPDEDLIREHSRMTGIPCNRIIKVSEVINPDTGRS